MSGVIIYDYLGLAVLVLLLLFLIPKVRRELTGTLSGGRGKSMKELLKEMEDKRIKEYAARGYGEDKVTEKKEGSLPGYESMSPENILLSDRLPSKDKISLLTKVHGYTWPEARELCEGAKNESEKAIIRFLAENAPRMKSRKRKDGHEESNS